MNLKIKRVAPRRPVRSLSPRPSGRSPTAHTTIVMAFWGLEIKPGKNPTPLNLERRLVIKQAALSVSKSSPEPVVLSVRAHSCRLQRPSARASVVCTAR